MQPDGCQQLLELGELPIPQGFPYRLNREEVRVVDDPSHQHWRGFRFLLNLVDQLEDVPLGTLSAGKSLGLGGVVLGVGLHCIQLAEAVRFLCNVLVG